MNLPPPWRKKVSEQMIYSSIIAYLHFMAAFGVVLSVTYQWVTFDRSLTLLDARRIQKADIIYGVSAGSVLVFGYLRLFYFEKGSDYYFGDSFYYLKLYTFALVGIISIYPTVRFWKWRKTTKAGNPPVIEEKEFVITRWILRVEVIGLLIMILAASMMAKGVGYPFFDGNR